MGLLAGEMKVVVVKHRRKYDATNRLSLMARGVREIYTWRHEIAEVIQALKAQLSLEACQAGDKRSQTTVAPAREGVQAHHIALCAVASLILERERLDQGITLHQLRRKLIVRGLQISLPSLKRVRMAA